MSKLVDLDKIPQRGPFKTYRNWLLWKLQRMISGESFRLPIFSQFVITRVSQGFLLDNGTICAFTLARADDILLMVESGHYRARNRDERSMVKMATAAKMKQSGSSFEEIAVYLNKNLNTVRRYIELAA